MLFDKLRHIEERSNEIARALSDPAIFSQPSEYARLRKEHAETVEIVERFATYRDVLRRIGEARHILAEAATASSPSSPRPRSTSSPPGRRRWRRS